MSPEFVQTGLLLPPAIPLKSSEVKGPHIKKDDPLFSYPPRAEDILQGMLGDCALLALLKAIVRRPGGPNFIMKMMSDHGDFVVFRLHRDQKEHFIKIEKSVRLSLGSIAGVSMSAGALWVKMIEKGVTAFSLEGDYSKWEKGISSDHIIKMILGKNVETIFTTIDIEQNLFTKLAGLPKLLSMAKELEAARIAHPESKSVLGLIEINNSKIEQICKLGLDLDEEEVIAWEKICNGEPDSLKTRWLMFNNEFLKTHGVVRQNDFQQFISSIYSECKAEQKKLLEKILSWSEKSNIFPGKGGSGIYTDAQLKIYDRIKELKDRCVILAGTFKSFKKPSSIIKGLGGEEIHKGLVANHYYAVTNCKEEKGLLFIQVENPWGDGIFRSVGRDYHFDKRGYLTPRKIDSAVSYIELSDFTKRFENITLAEFLDIEQASSEEKNSEPEILLPDSKAPKLSLDKPPGIELNLSRNKSLLFSPKAEPDDELESEKIISLS